MTKFVLAECIDRDIYKVGVYGSQEEAHAEMTERVSRIIDEEITCDEDGYACGENWEVQTLYAWVDYPKGHTHDHYDYAILEV